jgi:hypothetical protein
MHASPVAMLATVVGSGHPYSHIMDYEPGRVLIIIL